MTRDDSIATCQARIAALEKTLWTDEFSESLLEQYHAAFRQLEQQIASSGRDNRHSFVIVIPVADRPQHLQSCLESLLQLCRAFAYGGFDGKRYGKVSVIIADDSKLPENIGKNRAIADNFSAQGIATSYFGLSAQLAQIDALSKVEQEKLLRILGPVEREAFYHKGPSRMRNIVYLRLNDMARELDNPLFYFIDSDQEFHVKVGTPAGDKNPYAINYFYHLDQIFSHTDSVMLTGKVVGDPPVSPAVMAGNFLEDVLGFVQRIAALAPAQPCCFHGPQQAADDAAYHDMAALFGFTSARSAYEYRCTLTGAHDHARCFGHFSNKLGRFFYGEHPTRKTYYQHEDVMGGIKPARTVYTGNYIFRPEALHYFIPFATLKLRMAGPVLGRIVKSELDGKFVSANLPMLHKRTVRTTGQSEFRPGVRDDVEKIDLSGEFERQFYGDVMLFSMEKLTAQGYPGQTLPSELIRATLEDTHTAILAQYDQKRHTSREKLDTLRALVLDPKQWWNQSNEQEAALAAFHAFMDNIEHNFGASSPCYDLVHSPSNKARRHAEISAAIAAYAQDRAAWQEVLAAHARP